MNEITPRPDPLTDGIRDALDVLTGWSRPRTDTEKVADATAILNDALRADDHRRGGVARLMADLRAESTRLLDGAKQSPEPSVKARMLAFASAYASIAKLLDALLSAEAVDGAGAPHRPAAATCGAYLVGADTICEQARGHSGGHGPAGPEGA